MLVGISTLATSVSGVAELSRLRCSYQPGTGQPPAGRRASQKGYKVMGVSPIAPGEAQVRICLAWCVTFLTSWLGSCVHEHRADASCCSSHLVALSMPFTSSRWTSINGCLRSWGPASGFLLSRCQGSDYPSFSCSTTPLQCTFFSFNSQQSESWEGRRDFCRPAVQKTKLLDAFSYPFSNPWEKKKSVS